MRKLKLQVQMSIDGFVAGTQREMDWMTLDWDEELKQYVNQLTEPVDAIVLGRNLAQGFIDAWSSKAKDPDADWFTHKMNNTSKVVFSNTVSKVHWKDTVLATGDIVREIGELKSKEGGDIITYGGAGLVSSLIKQRLVDEFYLFINPVAIGSGAPIFAELDSRQAFTLKGSKSFKCGIVVLNYLSKAD